MSLVGSVVIVNGDKSSEAYINNMSFNENELAVRVAAFNDQSWDKITTDELKKSFYENGELYNAYSEWFWKDESMKYLDNYSTNLNFVLKDQFNTTITEATPEELEKAIEIVRSK